MVQVSSNLANPLVMIFTNVPKIKSIQPIVEKLQSISKYPLSHSKKEHISSFDFCICTKDLGFSYDKQKEVLNEIRKPFRLFILTMQVQSNTIIGN